MSTWCGQGLKAKKKNRPEFSAASYLHVPRLTNILATNLNILSYAK
jgi:hypothetical protein